MFVIQSECLGIDLKAAVKFFGQKFACGSSLTGDDEIVIQGDVKDDLFDVIPEKWPQVCAMFQMFCLKKDESGVSLYRWMKTRSTTLANLSDEPPHFKLLIL